MLIISPDFMISNQHSVLFMLIMGHWPSVEPSFNHAFVLNAFVKPQYTIAELFALEIL